VAFAALSLEGDSTGNPAAALAARQPENSGGDAAARQLVRLAEDSAVDWIGDLPGGAGARCWLGAVGAHSRCPAHWVERPALAASDPGLL